MDTKILEDLGFTGAEIKIYLALLSLGRTTAGPILQKTKLHNSIVHRTLSRLIEKGLVSFIIEGKVKHYQATSPKNIEKSIDENKKRFEKILPNLLQLNIPLDKQEAKIFRGFSGFKNALQEFIADSKKGDEYLIFSLGAKNLEKYEHIIRYYQEFEKERRKRGIISKAIAPESSKEKLKESSKIIDILFVNFPVPLDVSIFQDKIFLSSWGEEDSFFLIYSAGLAESFKSYFYSIWDKYKK